MLQAYRQIDQLGLPAGLRYAVENRLRRYVQNNPGASAQAVYRAVQRAVKTLAGPGPYRSRFEQNLGPTTAPATVERPAKRRNFGPVDAMPLAMGYKNDASGYNQREDRRKIVRTGRYKSKKQKMLAMMRSHVDTLVERFQGNNDANSTLADIPNTFSGYYKLASGPTSTAGLTANWWQYPIYLFDLTGVHNNNCITNANIHPGVAYTLARKATLTPWNVEPEWVSGVQGRNFTDTGNVVTWAIEKTGFAAGVMQKAGEACYIDSVRVNLAIFGAKRLPCKVFVELWRFTDESICPNAATANNLSATSVTEEVVTQESTKLPDWASAFWSSKIGVGVGIRQFAEEHKGISRRVIQSIDFNPTAAYENDPSGHQRNLDLYIPMNRYCKLDWYGKPSINENALDEVNADKMTLIDGSTNEFPFPRQNSRIFLCVRAEVQQSAASNAGYINADLFPSFDIVLRRYRTSLK